ncbi:TadE family protein [Cellulomonas sp. KH9]|uniref:TadE family protein n=1 Tax=Cellulomonas sp. KH9 TaxID=1855324 RepID=UPI000A65D797|nr:TadE family protein [Cellulomonas sp. KH9]
MTRRRPPGPGGRDDRGASTIEMVFYTPLLMLAILAIVQFSLTWYGNELAGAVARETARVVRTGGGSDDSVTRAHQRGTEYAGTVGGASLRDVSVEISRPDAQTVRVTVTGRAVEIVQGLAPRVSATVQGPVEGFRADL